MTWLSLAGAVPIAIALRDIFHTLFHPAASGGVGRAVQRLAWRTFRQEQHAEDPDVRLARLATLEALADYAELIATEFLGPEAAGTAEALGAYRDEHQPPGLRSEGGRETPRPGRHDRASGGGRR